MPYEYKFNVEKCWYKDGYCEFYNTLQCNSSCVRFIEMDYLMWASKIPPARQKPFSLIPQYMDLDAFNTLKYIKDNIKEFVAQGKNLYIYSEHTGNGKSSWAIKLLQSYFNKIWNGNRFRVRGVFVFVPKLLMDIKNNYDKNDPEFREFINSLTTADVVVWDDIGATKLSEHDYTLLLNFIDQRRLNLQSNIFTGNLPADKLKEYVGERLYSRIWESSMKVELLGSSRRDFNGTDSDFK